MANPEPRATNEAPVHELRMVELARRGDAAAYDRLVSRYLPFVKAKAAGYEHLGVDVEKLIQRGLIGLYCAVRDLPLGEPSLRNFAELRITREIIQANTRTPSKHNH